jgi:hypothetical protein
VVRRAVEYAVPDGLFAAFASPEITLSPRVVGQHRRPPRLKIAR